MKQAAVLVHCLTGVSRSATVVAAYLMTLCDMSFFNVISFISRKWPLSIRISVFACNYATLPIDDCATMSREKHHTKTRSGQSRRYE
ncbi:unnamed protein product [Cylicocyclus nassatus]|uniref:Tyrosine specific protein phosphatases domain-containing protein n=1 Tax=Cylicocyclus nassatus TaxID=53992 RepID=A0AA36DS55_CYLNA|nr:unnamed protein product [Cylicocyclus nassatus]